jgi:hypothetical protein
MQGLNLNVADREELSVFSLGDLEPGLGIWPIDDRRTGRFAQLQVTGNKVGMKVRLEDVFDRYALLFGELQVRVDIAQGIHDRGLTVAGNKVSRFGKAARIELFDFHELIDVNCLLIN